MKVYQLEYSYDEFMDGRIEGGVHLFSTLDKAFQFCELYYEKKREYFKGEDGVFHYAEYGEWHTRLWLIREVILDEDLEKELESK